MKYINETMYSDGFCPFKAEFRDTEGHYYYVTNFSNQLVIERSVEPADILQFSDSEIFLEMPGSVFDFESFKELTKDIFVWEVPDGTLGIKIFP